MHKEIVCTIILVVTLIVRIMQLWISSVIRLSTSVVKRMPGGSHAFHYGITHRVNSEFVYRVVLECIQKLGFVGNLDLNVARLSSARLAYWFRGCRLIFRLS